MTQGRCREAGAGSSDAAPRCTLASRLIIGGRLPADQVAGGWGSLTCWYQRAAATAATARWTSSTIARLRRGMARQNAAALLLAADGDRAGGRSSSTRLRRAQDRREDLLQLAHYQRMLEAAGLAAADGRHGGIVGVESAVTGTTSTRPIWATPSVEPTGRSSARRWRSTTSSSTSGSTSSRSPLLHQDDPAVGRWSSRCGSASARECPWWSGAARHWPPDLAT